MTAKIKKYVVAWFVADNSQCDAHWDRMQVRAVSRTSAIKTAINRIKIEFDYDFKYCTITGVWEV